MKRALTLATVTLSITVAAAHASPQHSLRLAESAASGRAWMQQALILCQKTPDRAALAKLPAPPPSPAFDDLYYVGDGLVSAWVVKTGDGLILIDTLNTGAEAVERIKGGIQQLGLEFTSIRYVVVTHGHLDHVGGLSEIHRMLPTARIVMTREAYREAVARQQGGGPVPVPDIAPKDGEVLKLGNTSLKFYVTPGHSPGTLSMIVPVHDHGMQHNALLMGGSASANLPQDQLRLYRRSVRRLSEIARQRRADIVLSNHPLLDGTAMRLAVRAATPDAPSPFIVTEADVARYYRLVDACAAYHAASLRDAAR